LPDHLIVHGMAVAHEHVFFIADRSCKSNSIRQPRRKLNHSDASPYSAALGAAVSGSSGVSPASRRSSRSVS
jgi:hypothetical protein